MAVLAAVVTVSVLVLRGGPDEPAPAAGPASSVPAAARQAVPTPAMRRLRAALEDLPGDDRTRYDAKDDAGFNLEGLKVVATRTAGAPRYVGVYHHRTVAGFVTAVAVSDDLMTWSRRATLGTQASQPTIRRLAGGSYLLAWEQEPRNHVRVLHAPDLDALLRGRFDARFDAPLTLAETAEGTPDIRSVRMGTGPGDSRVELGLHYYRDRDVDRQATATLTDFRTWTARRRPALDAALERHGLRGNLGDRDTFGLDGARYEIVEGQRRKDDWSSWRTYLRHDATGALVALRIRGRDGQTALGNPTVSILPGPRGGTVLFRSAFAFGESAPRGAGELLSYRRLR